MGNSTQAAAKEPTEVKVAVKPLEGSPESGESPRKLPLFDLKNLRSEKFRRKCFLCHQILFTFFAVLVIMGAIGLIITVVMTSVANRIFSEGQSGRVMAAVILAFTSAVTISMVIYALFGLYKKHKKPLCAAALVLIVMAVVQAIIAGAAVNMTEDDEVSLSNSLLDTFASSKIANSRQRVIWSAIQNSLSCCGIHGATDYGNPFTSRSNTPNVPISCCPNYDSGRSELVQERERESCIALRTYFNKGCRELIIEGVKDAAQMILSITIGLIIIETISTMLSFILYKKMKWSDESKAET